MSMSLIKSAMLTLGALRLRMSVDGWAEAERIKAEKIALFRDYVDGAHEAKLTDNMKRLLRIKSGLDEFTDNYMDVIIQTMVNRLEVTSIDADNDSATKWIQTLLDDNRFDGIQDDIHEATIRDGVSYVMPEWDNEAGRVTFNHELAYDGHSGMVVAYGEKNIEVAIKIWHITSADSKITDIVRVNVYLPGEIRKYVSSPGGAGMQKFEVQGEAWPAPWTMPNGEAIGIPVVAYRNRIRKKTDDGKSEIENAIPLQNILNRTLYSMVMASELSAFQILVAKGFTPPPGLTPGMWIPILDSEGNAPTKDQDVDAFAIPGGQIMPFIDECKFIAGEIGRITQTPAPELVWGEVSGESLKQREVGLLGKLKRFKVKAGNSWEDTMRIAHRIQEAFGDKPPAFKRLTTRWHNSEIRDDSATIDNALKVREIVGDKGVMELIAPVFGWDQDKITEILASKQADDLAKLAAFSATMPRFGANNPEANSTEAT